MLGREGLRSGLTAKVARISTNFSRRNTTIEPTFRVSRISVSSQKFLLWSIQICYNIIRNFIDFQYDFCKLLGLSVQFIPMAEAMGVLGGEDKYVYQYEKMV